MVLRASVSEEVPWLSKIECTLLTPERRNIRISLKASNLFKCMQTQIRRIMAEAE
jgi:hypothetical protein